MSLLRKKMARIFGPSEVEAKILDMLGGQARWFETREDIVSQGERTWKCCLLLEGMVCRYRTLNGGRRQILAFQYPGDVFDSYSFVLEVLDHSICAQMRSRIAFIPHERMRQVTEEFPRLARAFWKDTMIDAAVFAEWMTNIRSKPPHAQIAHLICEVYTRYDVVGLAEGSCFPWPISPSDASEALGLAPDYVKVILEDFHARGWVTILQGKMTLHDFTSLQREAEFDRSYLHLHSPKGAAHRLSSDWIRPL